MSVERGETISVAVGKGDCKGIGTLHGSERGEVRAEFYWASQRRRIFWV
jgi:hypothetical protein